jgi:arylsulfatase A-like enzyme
VSAFAEGCLRFDACHAVATWTLPATASLLTGTHPLEHRTVVTEWSPAGKARGNQFQVLPASVPTTAEVLARAGYHTAQFQANPNADASRGLGRGAAYRGISETARPAEHLDAVLDWLENEAREPFYCYIHLLDPHEPYRADPQHFRHLMGRPMEALRAPLPAPEAEALRDYHQQTWADLFSEGQRLDADTLRGFSPAAVEYLAALYDSEIREVDRQFGRLQDWMAARGWADRTVTVLTSDHGEAFGEDGQFYHGNYLHDAQTHVPLLIQVPGGGRGRAVPHTVSQLDLHPTLLALAGVDPDLPTAGRPLCSRTGAPQVHSHQAALTMLDLHHPDPATWQGRIAWGALRVSATEDAFTVSVEHVTHGTRQRVNLTQVDRVRDRAVRAAATSYFELRQHFNRRAARIPAPSWRTQLVSNEEAMRAMGYL